MKRFKSGAFRRFRTLVASAGKMLWRAAGRNHRKLTDADAHMRCAYVRPQASRVGHPTSRGLPIAEVGVSLSTVPPLVTRSMALNAA